MSALHALDIGAAMITDDRDTDPFAIRVEDVNAPRAQRRDARLR